MRAACIGVGSLPHPPSQKMTLEGIEIAGPISPVLPVVRAIAGGAELQNMESPEKGIPGDQGPADLLAVVLLELNPHSVLLALACHGTGLK